MYKRYGNTEEAYEAFLQRAAQCNPPLDGSETPYYLAQRTGFLKRISAQDDYIPPETYNLSGYLYKPMDDSEVVDFAVENALLKKALAGDVTAMILWLKNRRRDKWRDRYDTRTDEPGLRKVEALMKGLDGEAKDSTDA